MTLVSARCSRLVSFPLSVPLLCAFTPLLVRLPHASELLGTDYNCTHRLLSVDEKGGGAKRSYIRERVNASALLNSREAPPGICTWQRIALMARYCHSHAPGTVVNRASLCHAPVRVNASETITFLPRALSYCCSIVIIFKCQHCANYKNALRGVKFSVSNFRGKFSWSSFRATKVFSLAPNS